MTAKSLKKQYQDCYRLERLIQQCFALADLESGKELMNERRLYDYTVAVAATYSWLLRHGYTFNRIQQWREDYRLKELSQ